MFIDISGTFLSFSFWFILTHCPVPGNPHCTFHICGFHYMGCLISGKWCHICSFVIFSIYLPLCSQRSHILNNVKIYSFRFAHVFSHQVTYTWITHLLTEKNAMNVVEWTCIQDDSWILLVIGSETEMIDLMAILCFSLWGMTISHLHLQFCVFVLIKKYCA